MYIKLHIEPAILSIIYKKQKYLYNSVVANGLSELRTCNKINKKTFYISIQLKIVYNEV